MGSLYLVSTPIGNLEDITLRALRVLKEVDLIATEDTRATGRLLAHYGIEKPLLCYFEHNKLARLEKVLQALEEGDVALVSEAGTPVFSDPGFELVRAAIAREVPIVPVPGASALTATLPAAGLPIDQFIYLGFLPRRKSARQRILRLAAQCPVTLVFFEAPHRLLDTLNDAIECFGGERRCVVCREVTKLYEEFWRGTLSAAAEEFNRRTPRGEFTLIIDRSPSKEQWTENEVINALKERMLHGSGSNIAAKDVAVLSGWRKSEIYRLSETIYKLEEK